MTQDLTKVLIFQTNINTEEDRQKISDLLQTHPLISEWSVDLEDIDRVLRVVSDKLGLEDVIKLVTNCGFVCQELE